MPNQDYLCGMLWTWWEDKSPQSFHTYMLKQVFEITRNAIHKGIPSCDEDTNARNRCSLFKPIGLAQLLESGCIHQGWNRTALQGYQDVLPGWIVPSASQGLNSTNCGYVLQKWIKMTSKMLEHQLSALRNKARQDYIHYQSILCHSISSAPCVESIWKHSFAPHSWPRDAKGQDHADNTPEDRQMPSAAHQRPQTLRWESFNPLSGPLRQVFIPECTRGVWVILGTGDGRHKQNAKVTIVIETKC